MLCKRKKKTNQKWWNLLSQKFFGVSFVSFYFTLFFNVENCRGFLLLSVRREGPARRLVQIRKLPCHWLWLGLGAHSFYSSKLPRTATELAKPLKERVRKVIQRQLRMPYPRAIWACPMGTRCPPGQLKEMELPGSCPCPSVWSRSTFQADLSCFRKTNVTDVPVMPCWAVCNGALSNPVHPWCRSTVSWQLSSQQLELAFPYYTSSCSPLAIVHIPLKVFLLHKKFAIYIMISRRLWYSERCFGCCLKGHA